MSSASAATTSVLNVCPLGMDERSHQTLRMFFERQLGGTCVLSGRENAHVVLIDIDAYQSKALLDEELRDHAERPLILLSLNDTEALIPNAVLVKKPVKIELFAHALRELSQRLFEPKRETHFSSAAEQVLEGHRVKHLGGGAAQPQHVESTDVAAVHLQSRISSFYIGSMPDADLSDPAQRAKVFYEPDHFLQGHLQRAFALGIENASVVRLSGSAFQHMDIYPFARRVAASAPSSTLYAGGRLPTSNHDVTIELVADAPHFPPEFEKTEDLDVMLWKLALWASRGRVPLGTDLDWPVYLKRWPNLTRLLVPPHATRTAGLWARQRFGLAETAVILGIPQRFVFSFYSACAAIELTTPARRAADVLVEAEAPKAHERRGLFRLLLNKLIGDRDD